MIVTVLATCGTDMPIEPQPGNSESVKITVNDPNLVRWTDFFRYISLQAMQMEMTLRRRWFWTFMAGQDLAAIGEKWMMLLMRIQMVGLSQYMLKGMGTQRPVLSGRVGIALGLMAH